VERPQELQIVCRAERSGMGAARIISELPNG
jgi:hypothetical protein